MVAQVESFLDEKLAAVRRHYLSPATYEYYTNALRVLWLRWAESAGVTEASQCTDAVLEKYTDFLVNRTRAARGGGRVPVSIATVRSNIRALMIFLKWANVPRGKYRQPKKPRRLLETLSRQEIDQLERATTDERDRLIVRTLADTGMRAGELIGIRPRDLRANTHDRIYTVRIIGKGDKEREIPITKDLYARLKDLGECTGGTYIFESRGNRRKNAKLTPHAINQIIRHLALGAAMDKRVFPHLFRHSFATHMATQGVPINVTQAWMGHESLAMLATVYSHVTGTNSYDLYSRALR